jgi:hypothetical protein
MLHIATRQEQLVPDMLHIETRQEQRVLVMFQKNKAQKF